MGACAAVFEAPRFFHEAAMTRSKHAYCKCDIPQEAMESLWQWTLETSRSRHVTLKEERRAVLLHVYDYSSVTSYLGLPWFHIGVEVCGKEISFGQNGVQLSWPGDFDPPRHKHVVLL